MIEMKTLNGEKYRRTQYIRLPNHSSILRDSLVHFSKTPRRSEGGDLLNGTIIRYSLSGAGDFCWLWCGHRTFPLLAMAGVIVPWATYNVIQAHKGDWVRVAVEAPLLDQGSLNDGGGRSDLLRSQMGHRYTLHWENTSQNKDAGNKDVHK